LGTNELILRLIEPDGSKREWKIWSGNISCGPLVGYYKSSNKLKIEWGMCGRSRWQFGRADFSLSSRLIERIFFSQNPKKSNSSCSDLWECSIAQSKEYSAMLTISPFEKLSLWELNSNEVLVLGNDRTNNHLVISNDEDERKPSIVKSGEYWNLFWHSKGNLWTQSIKSNEIGKKKEIKRGNLKWVSSSDETFAIGLEKEGKLFVQIFNSSGEPFLPPIIVSDDIGRFQGVRVNPTTYNIHWENSGKHFIRGYNLKGWEGSLFVDAIQHPTLNKRDIEKYQNGSDSSSDTSHFNWWWIFTFPVPFFLVACIASICIVCQACSKHSRERRERSQSTSNVPSPQPTPVAPPPTNPEKDDIPSPTFPRTPQISQSEFPSLPERFFDPVFGVLMRNPVVTPDGRTYERTAIEEWINQHHTNPVTREPLRKRQLIPNRMVSDDLEMWLKQNEESHLQLQTHLSRTSSSQNIDPSTTK